MLWRLKLTDTVYSTLLKIACFVTLCTFSRCGSDATPDQVLTKEQIVGYESLRWEEDSTVLVMSSNMTISFQNKPLLPGKYKLTFRARGNSAAGVLPNLLVRFEEIVVKDQGIAEGASSYNVRFQTKDSINFPLQLQFTNDYSSEKEDRNIFLHFPVTLSKL